MTSTPTTAWMWQDGMYTRGAILELADNSIEWQMDTPCNCSAEIVTQPMTDFLAYGADRYLIVPEDIMAEIKHAVTQLTTVRG